MHEPGSLRVEDCWAPGGRLSLTLADEGQRVILAGNREGLVGLARVLLYLANHELEGADRVHLAALNAHDAGEPRLEIVPAED